MAASPAARSLAPSLAGTFTRSALEAPAAGSALDTTYRSVIAQKERELHEVTEYRLATLETLLTQKV